MFFFIVLAPSVVSHQVGGGGGSVSLKLLKNEISCMINRLCITINYT